MYYSACVPALFRGRPAHEALPIVAACGLTAYEFWGWWDIGDLSALEAAQHATGLRCSAMCTRMVPLTDPARRSEYIDGLRESITVARRFGCTTLISQVGPEITGMPRSDQHRSIVDGLRVACACIPMATGAAISAPAQGRVAANAVNLMAKRPDDWAKGIILCITVEFYAILCLLASFLMLLNLKLGA